MVSLDGSRSLMVASAFICWNDVRLRTADKLQESVG